MVYFKFNIFYNNCIRYTGKVNRMKKIKLGATLADQAYEYLKESIVQGRLRDGEQLPEERIAEELGISRTPLRDALGRLAAEGLVILERGKPAQVSSFTKERSLEYLELRSLLEVYNIEKIISKVDEAFINQLKENVKAQLKAIEANNYPEFMDLDREFHIILASKNENQELKNIIHRMNTGTNRAFLLLSKTVPQSAEEAYKEHLEIIDALENKDVALARSKMIVHMNNVEKRFLNYYNEEL